MTRPARLSPATRRTLDRANARQAFMTYAAMAAAAMSGLCIGFVLPVPAVMVSFEVVAVDSMGEAWTVGAGDSCPEAWQGAWEHVPADWVEVECAPVTLRDLIAR